MIGNISKRCINCCKLLITRYSHLAHRESAITAPVSSEHTFLDKHTSNPLLPEKLDESSNSDLVKKNTFHYPEPGIGKSPLGIFAYYIKKSEVLQELFRLGVNLHQIEKNTEATQFLLRCSFEDIREHIIFLKEVCLEIPRIGRIISKNPLILKEDLEDLKVRVNYLKYKKFDDNMITRIIQENPLWLTHR